MKLKKPKLDDKNHKYLGHFRQQRFVDEGHNTVEKQKSVFDEITETDLDRIDDLSIANGKDSLSGQERRIMDEESQELKEAIRKFHNKGSVKRERD